MSPGDTVRFDAVVRNLGDVPVDDVRFVVSADPNGALVAGSVNVSQGTVTSGNGAATG